MSRAEGAFIEALRQKLEERSSGAAFFAGKAGSYLYPGACKRYKITFHLTFIPILQRPLLDD